MDGGSGGDGLNGGEEYQVRGRCEGQPKRRPVELRGVGDAGLIGFTTSLYDL